MFAGLHLLVLGRLIHFYPGFYKKGRVERRGKYECGNSRVEGRMQS